MNDLERRVLETIGEDADSPDVYSDDATGLAPIRDSLNDAIQEICLVTGSTTRKLLLPLEANITFYQITLDRDYLAWITGVWLYGQKRRLTQADIAYLAAQHPLWLKNTGNPIHYGMVGKDYFFVHPTPTAAAEVLEIDAVVIPSRYTEDDERIRLRQQYQKAAVNYAVSEWWADHGDAKQAAEYFKKYLNALGMQGLYQETYERPWAAKTDKAVAA